MKVFKVIRREYVEAVRRKSFIISTLLIPVMMLVFFAVPVMLASVEPDKSYHVAIIDQTGVLGVDFAAALTDTLKNGGRKYRTTVTTAKGDEFDRERTARVRDVQHEALDIVIAIPSTVMDDGKAAYITREERNYNVLEHFQKVLTDVVIKQRLAAEGLDFARVKSLTTEVKLEMNQVTTAGAVEKKDFMGEYGVVFLFTMFLYLSLLSWGMAISKSIIEEKSSRVIEVLLSSLSPKDLMIGKLVGVGLVGLTQLSVWALLGLGVSAYAATGMVALLSSVHIPPIVFVYFVVYFVLGFMMYSALFMTVGSICTTDQDAQHLQSLITLPMLVPVLTLMLVIQNPAGGLAVGLSLVPLFTPMMMLARIILLQPPAWQILLSIALMLATIYLLVSFAAKVFRVGILMYGKPPSLRELAHWYRQAR